HRDGRERIPALVGAPGRKRSIRRGAYKKRKTNHPDKRREAGWACNFLFASNHPRFFLAGVLVGSPGRAHVSPAGMDQNAFRSLLFAPCDHPGSSPHDDFSSRTFAARIRESLLALDSGPVSASSSFLPPVS